MSCICSWRNNDRGRDHLFISLNEKSIIEIQIPPLDPARAVAAYPNTPHVRLSLRSDVLYNRNSGYTKSKNIFLFSSFLGNLEKISREVDFTKKEKLPNGLLGVPLVEKCSFCADSYGIDFRCKRCENTVCEDCGVRCALYYCPCCGLESSKENAWYRKEENNDRNLGKF